jgi:peptidoglycan/xylan/chitin deacetylase (PgdA/CDA1 family)
MVWQHGYRLFMRLQGYRLLREPAASSSPGAFRILTFHDVPESQHKAFDRLLRHVLDRNGFLTPAEAEARLEGKDPSGLNDRTPFLLTFDDGFSSNVSVAREILDQYGLKAIFFVCPGLMDIAREKHREAIVRFLFEGWLDEAKVPDDISLMTWAGAEELVRSGHTIGSHTLHHFRLSKLSEQEQREEIVASAERLEHRMGVPIDWFAFPFGDLASIDRSSLRIIAERYRFCCSGLRGLNSTGTRPIELLREAVDLASPFEFQRLILNGGMDFRHQKRVKQLAKLVTAGSARIEAPAIA